MRIIRCGDTDNIVEMFEYAAPKRLRHCSRLLQCLEIVQAAVEQVMPFLFVI